MSQGQPDRGSLRERLPLALGFVSALLLAGAALAPFSDPDLAGRAALAQLAGRVADGIAAEWERMLREPDLPATPRGDSYAWDAGAAVRPPLPVPLDVRPSEGARETAFDALLAESERLELQPDGAAGALELVLEALQKEIDEGRRAEGRLRAIQLGVRASRPDVVREQLARAWEELRGLQCRGDTPYLVLCTLAAAPRIPDEERVDLSRRLVDLWRDGLLALPADEARSAARNESSPRRMALWEKLSALAGIDSPPPDAERRRTEVLARDLDGLPPEPADGAWHVRPAQERLFLWRASPSGGSVGAYVACPDLLASLSARLEKRDLVPAGFEVDFSGADDSMGPVVRPRTALSGDDLGFTLRHADPESVVRSASRRLWFVRAALLAMALFAAAAGVATFRALRRERKLAELKSAFVANVSHELRTPLASILLMAENLESGKVSDEKRERYHASIRREATRLRHLVDDVLDFSRLERGKRLDVRVEDVDLRAFADSLRTESEAWAAQAGVELAFAAGNLAASAPIDAEALRRAVFNLLDNAKKHSGSRAVSLSARVEGEELVLAVADRGRGIPSRRREEVFEPFARLSEGNGSPPGTGLGLAIVREIAQAHGGSVSVRDPEEGTGAVFVLRLPLESSRLPVEGSRLPLESPRPPLGSKEAPRT